jgi:aminoglycoside 3-N-acetyltransferase
VVRTWYPKHSVAALGKEAHEFIAGNEQFDTPCARESSWGKLLDQKAAILLIGVYLRRCTYIHGVEEWLDIPGRLTDDYEMLYTILPGKTEISIPQSRHIGHTSEKYDQVEDIFLKNKVIYKGQFGDATVRVCDTVKMTDLLNHLLKEKPDLFS